MPAGLIAAAVRTIVNLGSFGQQFVGVNDPKFTNPEYLAASATGMASDGLTAVFGQTWVPQALAKRVGHSQLTSLASSKAAQGASAILWTINIVEVLETLMGFGPPAEGDELLVGSTQFAKAQAQLGSALPDNSWQGSASYAYASQNTALQNRGQALAELDVKFAALVKDQAEWATHGRLGIAILKNLLLATFAVEMALMFAVPAGPAMARSFGFTVSGLGIAIAMGLLSTVLTYSVENSKKADVLTANYQDLTPDPYQGADPSMPMAANMPASAESTISSFAASGTAFTAEAAGSLGRASGAADESAFYSAAADEAVPLEDAPSATSAFTMPTLAQLMAISGQGAKFSGHVSQHANLANQAMGQVQQVASMAQQGKGTAPAEDTAQTEATTVEDVEGAGADSAGAAAGRAPIEAAAADTPPAQQPIFAQQVV
ncbi:EspA/EspE family type VII secretion system effector [Mycobacterium ulcerans]|uniref:ESX-1 secretion-associated protein EspA/EspE-like domain-containing protein n=3 Tax=Mycobacterium ulcerans TaxID=1809 RepID=A0ABY3V709_MYCUL|nr:EspA/EspE family type VII secretion system effector [Mycobacterium ulcerans]EUA89521.1 hypothetical protein I551_4050 [Mycobacterium ulcerans str. Harvey]ABL04896.1 conserved hypothetical membrane protein [Mycobacterium ulcerans Agy99]OIN22926.1 hypothetical protein A3649_11820 [Mycobacterium ulcerans]UDM32847.1 hypothetical protein LH162_13525 [Mycobacterium ulcerans]ULP50207.1 hypothetical protein MJO63_13515 [Mycobacterium ulcerans]